MNPWALLCGWAAGMAWGTQMAASLGLKSSVYPLHLFGATYAMYAAVPALLLNLLLSATLTLLFRAMNLGQGSDATVAEDYA
jgi:SSS family solute:Na+ symporter